MTCGPKGTNSGGGVREYVTESLEIPRTEVEGMGSRSLNEYPRYLSAVDIKENVGPNARSCQGNIAPIATDLCGPHPFIIVKYVQSFIRVGEL